MSGTVSPPSLPSYDSSRTPEENYLRLTQVLTDGFRSYGERLNKAFVRDGSETLKQTPVGSQAMTLTAGSWQMEDRSMNLCINATFGGGTWKSHETVDPSWRLRFDTSLDRGDIDRAVATTGSLTWTNNVRINSSGQVGINRTPVYRFHVNDGTNVNLGLGAGLNGAFGLYARNDAGTAYVPFDVYASRHILRFGNFGLDYTGTFGGGSIIMAIVNATSAPAQNPIGGGFLYSAAGAGTWRGSSGTVTTFGPAEPHCEKCGLDFVREFYNEAWGRYSLLCDWCGNAVRALRRGLEWRPHV